jgi:hypothetical protein
VEDVFPQPSLALRWTGEGGAPNLTERELRYNIVRSEEARFYTRNPFFNKLIFPNFSFNITITLFKFSIKNS